MFWHKNDRTTAVGCLPLLVSSTIRNLKVMKMLVDVKAALNPISPKVISKLQIAQEERKVTNRFQGVNPSRSHPKGKIMLPITFGGELNYQTEKIVFHVVKPPLSIQWDPWTPSPGKIHGGIPLCLQHPEDAWASRSHFHPIR